MAAKGVEKGQANSPDTTKCSLPQLSSYVTRTLLGQALLQTAQTTTRSKLPVRSEGPAYRPMSSLVMGLSPAHTVIKVGDDKQEWLTLLHLIIYNCNPSTSPSATRIYHNSHPGWRCDAS